VSDRIAQARRQITERTGAKTVTRLTMVGTVIGVQMAPNVNDAVWSIVPIGDENMNDFIDSLILFWQREGGTAVNFVEVGGSATEVQA
jgi:hypothetical protein